MVACLNDFTVPHAERKRKYLIAAILRPSKDVLWYHEKMVIALIASKPDDPSSDKKPQPLDKGLYFLIALIVLAVIGGIIYSINSAVTRSEIEAQGVETVAEPLRWYEYDGAGKKSYIAYSKIVYTFTVNGKEYKVEGEGHEGTFTDTAQNTQTATVKYLPKDPSKNFLVEGSEYRDVVAVPVRVTEAKTVFSTTVDVGEKNHYIVYQYEVYGNTYELEGYEAFSTPPSLDSIEETTVHYFSAQPTIAALPDGK